MTRLRYLLEICLFTGLLFGIGAVELSGLASILSLLANPLILGVIWLTATRLSGHKLSGIGLGWRTDHATPWPMRRLLLWSFMYLLIFFVIKLSVSPLLSYLGEEYFGGDAAAQTRAWGFLKGNLVAYLQWMGLIWLFAAIGEELFYRGLLMHRLEHILGGGHVAVVAAIGLQALLFGLLHLDTGAVQIVQSTFTGLIQGIAFYAFRRRLLPLILAHGLWDSYGLTLLFLGITTAE